MREPAGVGLLVLLSVFFGVLIADSVLHKIDGSPQRTYEACEQGDLRHCKTAPNGSPLLSSDPNTETGQDESRRDEYRSEKDLRAQQQMAWWALGMMVLTGIGVVLLFQTLDATRASVSQMQDANRAAWEAVKTTQSLGARQIEVAEASASDQREIGQRTNSSYIVIDKMRAVSRKDWGSEAIQLTCKNIGNTPAFNMTFSANVFFGSSYEILRRPFLKKPFHWNSFVYPGAHDKKSWFGFGRERVPDLGAKYIFIGGAIIWRDIFGEWRGNRFFFHASYAPHGPIGKFRPAQVGNELLEEWQLEELRKPSYKTQRLHRKDQPEYEVE